MALFIELIAKWVSLAAEICSYYLCIINLIYIQSSQFLCIFSVQYENDKTKGNRGRNMKKILTVVTLSFSALWVSNIAIAKPHSDEFQNDDNRGRGKGSEQRMQRDSSDSRYQERRKNREERGVKRLQQHKWQTGYVMPQHYRGNSYKTEYQQHDLPKPSRNQQWYKINNDYILVDSESNNIISIKED